MKSKARKKRSSAEPTSHNGVYRADELAQVFGLKKSVVFFWTVQEKLVTADYKGRPRRPSLFLEKTASTVFLIKTLLGTGVTKAEIRGFLQANRQMVGSEHPKDTDVAVIDKGYIKILVKVGAARLHAMKMLRAYVGDSRKETHENPKEPRVESGAVPTHRSEPVEGAAGLASI